MTKRQFGALSAVVLAGCAAALQANKRSPGTLENGEFKPQRPPQERYGADPALTCPAAGAHGALQDELNSRAKGGKMAQPDGRLCAMADTLLGWKQASDADLPPESVRSFLSQYFGLPGSVRRMLLSNVETEDAKNIATSVADAVASFTASAQKPLYGMMTERLKKGTTRVVLVFFDDVAQIEPLPRRLAPGQAATLAGSVAGELVKPRVEVVDPIGTLQKSQPQPGKAFRAEVKCADHPGKILVQVVAEKDGAEAQVTNFPVYCGAAPPLAVKLPTSKAGPVDLAAAEKELLDLVNSDRKAAGIKPLNALPPLSDIARQVAQKRAQGQGITSTDLNKALKDAEIAAPMLLESMAQAFTVEDAYTRFSESPSDRSNTMNPDVTDVGVGVVKGPMVGDKPTYIVAELFVKQRAPIDPAQVKAKLYDAIEKKRTDARVAAAGKDPTLEKVAQAYAEAAAANGGKPPKEKESQILAPLYKESMTVNQLGGFVPDEATAIEVAEQPSITGAAKLVGVGVALGKSPQFGKGSPFVMVLLGTRHDAKAGRGRPPRKK